ncbi:unnamed protein product, partial [marine sediment metagenome]
NAVGRVFDNKYYFSTSDDTLVFDLLYDRFYTLDFGLTALCYDHINNFLFGGHDNDVVKLEQDINQDSESCNFQLKSKAYALSEIEGKLGEIQDYLIQINTEGQDVSFKIYVDETLKQTITLNTDSMERITGSFGTWQGMYAEFELTYSGTKRIQLDMPIIINPKV